MSDIFATTNRLAQYIRNSVNWNPHANPNEMTPAQALKALEQITHRLVEADQLGQPPAPSSDHFVVETRKFLVAVTLRRPSDPDLGVTGDSFVTIISRESILASTKAFPGNLALAKAIKLSSEAAPGYTYVTHAIVEEGDL